MHHYNGSLPFKVAKMILWLLERDITSRMQTASTVGNVNNVGPVTHDTDSTNANSNTSAETNEEKEQKTEEKTNSDADNDNDFENMINQQLSDLFDEIMRVNPFLFDLLIKTRNEQSQIIPKACFIGADGITG